MSPRTVAAFSIEEFQVQRTFEEDCESPKSNSQGRGLEKRELYEELERPTGALCTQVRKLLSSLKRTT